MESRILKPVLAVYVGLFLFVSSMGLSSCSAYFRSSRDRRRPAVSDHPVVDLLVPDIFGLTSALSRRPASDWGIAVPLAHARGHDQMITSRFSASWPRKAFRKNFPGKTVSFYLIVLGMIVPGILVGLGSGLSRPPPAIGGIGEHGFCNASSIRCRLHFSSARDLQRFDASVEEAAWSLGVFADHDVPQSNLSADISRVLSAMLFAFTLSLMSSANGCSLSAASKRCPSRLLDVLGRDPSQPYSLWRAHHLCFRSRCSPVLAFS